MTALRIAHPGQPVTFDPADPSTNPATHVPLPGFSFRPRQIEPRIDLVSDERRAQLAEAQRRVRERQRAEARLDDPAFVASEEGQRYLEQWRAEHRRHRRTE